MMGVLGPGARDLLPKRRLLVEHRHRVARQQLEERPTEVFPFSLPRSLALHRQYRDPFDRLPGSLRVEIERPQRQDLVAPPLDPRRRRHPEPVHVEDAAAHAELRDLGDRRHARVAHPAQPPHALTQRPPPPSPLPPSPPPPPP